MAGRGGPDKDRAPGSQLPWLVVPAARDGAAAVADDHEPPVVPVAPVAGTVAVVVLVYRLNRAIKAGLLGTRFAREGHGEWRDCRFR